MQYLWKRHHIQVIYHVHLHLCLSPLQDCLLLRICFFCDTRASQGIQNGAKKLLSRQEENFTLGYRLFVLEHQKIFLVTSFDKMLVYRWAAPVKSLIIRPAVSKSVRQGAVL